MSWYCFLEQETLLKLLQATQLLKWTSHNLGKQIPIVHSYMISEDSGGTFECQHLGHGTAPCGLTVLLQEDLLVQGQLIYWLNSPKRLVYRPFMNMI